VTKGDDVIHSHVDVDARKMFNPVPFLLSLLFSLSSATRPGLVSSSVWYTNQTVLNTNYELGVVRMEFNQSLYVNGWTYLCSSAAKECPKLACRACDWSTPQVWMLEKEREKGDFSKFFLFLFFS